MKLYYHAKSKNFGDCLNYNIFRELFGRDVIRTRYYKADFFGIGSLLGTALYNPTPHHAWKNLEKRCYSILLRHRPITILGSGFVSNVRDTYRKLKLFRPVNIIALRGRKSREIMECILREKLDGVALGDPGILSSELIKGTRIGKECELGIIPHTVDRNSDLLDGLASRSGVRILDIQSPPGEFIKTVAACRTVASSALHGLIAADSLHIPNLWIKLSDRIIGQDFKFRDYYSAYGITPQVTDLRSAAASRITPEYVIERYRIDPRAVESSKSALASAFEECFGNLQYG